MVLDGLPHNLLKLVGGEGLADVLPNLTKFLKPGMLLQGTVLKAFPKENRAVIQLGNKQVIVETPEPLTPGRSFSARVESTSPHPVIKIVTHDPEQAPKLPQSGDKAIISPKQSANDTTRISQHKFPVPQQLTSSEIKSLNLTQGQIVNAKIINISGENTAVVRVHGKEVIAHFKDVIPPKPGAIIELMVSAHKGEFRLVAREGAVATRPVEVANIKPLLPFKEPFGEMVQKLDSLVISSELLKNFNTPNNPVGRLIKTLSLLKPQTQLIPDSTVIKEQIDLSGINYESKVKQVFEPMAKGPLRIPPDLGRDLKGQLLELVKTIEARAETKEMPTEQRRQLMEIVQTFRSAVDNVELQQLTNQLARQENQPMVLQIPNPFIGGEKTIKLYLRQAGEEQGGGKNKGKEGILLVFLLDLSALGNLRIDARMNKDRVSVKIHVENKAIADFIDANLGDFRSRLTDLGFQGEATCCVQKKIEHNFENELTQLFINDEDRLVDLTT